MLGCIGSWKNWTLFGMPLIWFYRWSFTVFGVTVPVYYFSVEVLLTGAYVAVMTPILHRVFLSQLTKGRKELDKERYDDDAAS